jgi:hypothetical protein
MATVTVDTKDYDKLHRELEKFKKTALPYAQRQALNDCAFELRKEWQVQIRRAFTIRSPFTERSIRVEKATGLDTRSMKAVTGSVALFMGDQEEGATIHGKAKHKAIPGPAAGGQAPGSGVRTGLIRARYRVGAITVGHPSLAKFGRRRQNAVVMAIAIRKSERFALLNRTKGGKGLFEVRGLKRGGREHGGGKTKLIWDLSKSSVKVKPTPTMHHAAYVCAPRFQRLTEGALLAQLKRHKVMGY